MDFKELQKRGMEIKKAYNELNIKNDRKVWGAAEHLQAYMGDLGDLAKLVMAKDGWRDGEDVDEKIKHELADCLWVAIVLAHEYNIDLEEAFLSTMDGLEKRIKSN